MRMLLATAALALACIPAHGYEGSGDLMALSLEELASIEVTVPGDYPQSLADAVGTIHVFSAAEIAERGWLHLGELLADLPGVDVQDYSESTSRNRIAFRGIAGNQRFLIQRDGVRISAPSGDPIGVLHNFPLYGLRQVEVSFGPDSAVYGADAFAAVVNLVGDDKARRGRVGGGAFGTALVEMTAVADLGEAARLSLYGSGHRSDNPDLAEYYPDDYVLGDLTTFGGRTVLDADERAGYAAPTRSRTFGARLALAGGAEFGFHTWRNREPSSHGNEPWAVDYGRGPLWETEVGSVYGRVTTDHGRGWESRIEAGYGWHRILADSKFANVFVDFQDGYKFARDEKAMIEARLEHSYGRGGRLAAGVMIERSWGIPKTADLTAPFAPGLPLAEQDQFYPGTGDSLRVKMFDFAWHGAGAFLHLDHPLTGDLRVVAGLRYDEHSQYGPSLNPRGGLVAALGSGLTWRTLYGEAYLAPAPLFVYEHFGSFSGERNAQGEFISYFFQVPNPDLEPEKLRSLETRLEYGAPRARAWAAVWGNKVDDIIAFTATDPPQSDFIPGGEILFTGNSANSGSLRAWGLELGGSGLFGDSTNQVRTWASYTYTDGEFGREKSPLPLIAPHKAKGGVTWRNASGLTVTPSVRWIGRTPVGTTGAEAGAYVVADLAVGYRFGGSSTRAWLRVTNVLDHRHRHATSGGTGLKAAAPQDPRWLLFGVDFEL